MFVRWNCAAMSGWLAINRCGLVGLTLFAIALLPSAILYAQQEPGRAQQEDRPANRAQRLERIEEAIRRLEQRLTQRSGEEGQGQWQDALEGLQIRLQERYALGIALNVQAEGDEESVTVSVQEVVPDSAADKAGFQAGDVILAVNDEALQGPEQLVEAVQATKGEAPLRIQILRDDETLVLEATPTRQAAEGGELGQFEWRGLLGDEGEGAIAIPNLPHMGEMIFPGNMNAVQAELDKLRADVDDLRQQMKEMSAQLKAIEAALKDRESE